MDREPIAIKGKRENSEAPYDQQKSESLVPPSSESGNTAKELLIVVPILSFEASPNT